jgi:hypothetical protein
MVWFTVPLASTKYVLGVCHSYVQWDPKRATGCGPSRLGREPAAGDDRVFDQYTMDGYTAQRYRGKIAFLTGIRAAESLIRFRACVNKLNENYINAVVDPARERQALQADLRLGRGRRLPLFLRPRIKYCSLYDLQMWAGKAAAGFDAAARRERQEVRPDQGDGAGLLRASPVFPEMLAHERYFKEMDREALQRATARPMKGVRLWIDENITEEKQHQAAVRKFDSVMGRAIKAPGSLPAALSA